MPDQAESDRLQALYSYDLLDTPPEEAFDRITRLAKAAFDVPVVLISLMDEDRQWFKSRQGIEACETAREVAFCRYTIGQNEPLIVPDVERDDRFKDNPLVADPGVRFYAGVPLATPAGHNVGTLCIIDMRPRRMNTAQVGMLRDLAQIVCGEFELRRLAISDSLTGALSRLHFVGQLRHELARARRHGRDLSVICADVDHFKRVNDSYGHAAGDAVLISFVRTLRQTLRNIDLVGRIGGEEFAVLLPETGEDAAMVVAEKLRTAMADARAAHGGESIGVTASFGVAGFREAVDDPKGMLAVADAALCEAKRSGRNRVVRGIAETSAYASRIAEALSGGTARGR